MAKVEVAFPAASGSIKTVLTVDEDQKVANKHEQVFWRFFGDDKRIDTVRVEFANPKHTFFLGKTPRHVCERKYEKGAVIYGTAPDFTKKTWCKYTVTGLQNGVVVSEKDPEIITDDPGSGGGRGRG